MELIKCLESGTLDEVSGIINRLEFLAEFGMKTQLSRVNAAITEAVRLEDLAAAARCRAKEMATDLAKEVARHWSADEIEEATGYTCSN